MIIIQVNDYEDYYNYEEVYKAIADLYMGDCKMNPLNDQKYLKGMSWGYHLTESYNIQTKQYFVVNNIFLIFENNHEYVKVVPELINIKHEKKNNIMYNFTITITTITSTTTPPTTITTNNNDDDDMNKDNNNNLICIDIFIYFLRN
ncbi:hypothetical protein H8356DRAFT_1340527 [Neocallimastix lanati (nom. inval.)]|nr:hypothetical protein H8356DRAFT_1340527 [Neocallimastix sp. JGI-2020a]